MKRRLILLAVLSSVVGGIYLLGHFYLWPPLDGTTFHALGIIEAQEVNLTSRIPGRIAESELVEGDTVHRGQVICRIEDVDLRNQLRQASATLEKARVDREDAQRNADRIQALSRSGVVSTKDRDDAVTRLDGSRAALLSAEANVQYFSDQLNDTRIVAPIDGVIVNKALEVGEWVNPGTPVMTVDDLSQIWARVDVQESDLVSIKVGNPARIILTTNPPVTVTGRVMSIGQEGEFATEHDVQRGRQDIRTFFVKVKVLQSDGTVKPGMTADVAFNRTDGIRISSNQMRSAD